MPSSTEPLMPTGKLSGRPQPTLSLGDLVVRPFRTDDAAAIVTAYEDPAIQRWHVRTVTPAEATEMIEANELNWQSETRIDWAVADGDGPVLGRVALNELNLRDGSAQFGYWTLPAARGRNVAVRGVCAVSEWAFGIGFHRLSLRHSVLNEPSCRVAIKSGYLFEGINRQHGRHADGWHNMHLHARLSTDPVPQLP